MNRDALTKKIAFDFIVGLHFAKGHTSCEAHSEATTTPCRDDTCGRVEKELRLEKRLARKGEVNVVIFLSSRQLPLLSPRPPFASPSLLLLVTLSLLHGDSDTAETLHLHDISDESHSSQTPSTSEKCPTSPAAPPPRHTPTPRRDAQRGDNL